MRGWWLPLLCGLAACARPDDSWPHWLGRSLEAPAPAAPSAAPVALRQDWRAKIGPGYSGIAVAGGCAVTMFSDGEHDLLAAFDARTGRPLWRHALGPTYRGHDGSADGPLSTPVAGHGRVHALGPRGQFVAVRLDDGTPIWSRDLPRDFGSTPPHFGFVTTPLLAGSTLVVFAGGRPGRAIVDLDAATGEPRWSHGDDEIAHQSPPPLTLAGRPQIVGATQSRIVALDPADGRVLWSIDHGRPDGAAKIVGTALDDGHFLVDYWNEAAVYAIEARGAAFEVRELHRLPDLALAFTPPVVDGPYVYGFAGGSLRCVRWRDGTVAWRSDAPGGRSLARAGERLAVLGRQGIVVLIDADPRAYREHARRDALGADSLTRPSHAGHQIFVRGARELVALSLVPAPAYGAQESTAPGG